MKRCRREQVLKICGADVEFLNCIFGLDSDEESGDAAGRALLREIDGVPAYPQARWLGGTTPQGETERGRKFLQTGASCYLDMTHFEYALQEVASGFDHVAAWHAALRTVHEAQRAANAKLPRGCSLGVYANNTDFLGHSFGAHLNFLITRRAFDDLFHRRLHYLVFLAGFQASSIVLTGQGKVGSENDQPFAPFQLSQRSDFVERLVSLETTFNRGLVNLRDESHCGRDSGLARLHSIFFDSTLAHTSSLLKVGLMQIALAMIESGDVDAALLLEDPVAALHAWSRDPGLRSRAPLICGQHVTAVGLQRLFWHEAQRAAAAGALDVVPRSSEILQTWGDTLDLLEMRDYGALEPLLDWVRKRKVLLRALAMRPDLTWRSPELQQIDLLYSSVDPGEGVYWAFERAAEMRTVVSEESIDDAQRHPPEDTRAWTRGLILRLAGPYVTAVDWGSISLVDTDSWTLRRIDMPDPRGHTRAQTLARLGTAPTAREIIGVLSQPMAPEDHLGGPRSARPGAAERRPPAETDIAPHEDPEP